MGQLCSCASSNSAVKTKATILPEKAKRPMKRSQELPQPHIGASTQYLVIDKSVALPRAESGIFSKSTSCSSSGSEDQTAEISATQNHLVDRASSGISSDVNTISCSPYFKYSAVELSSPSGWDDDGRQLPLSANKTSESEKHCSKLILFNEGLPDPGTAADRASPLTAYLANTEPKRVIKLSQEELLGIHEFYEERIKRVLQRTVDFLVNELSPLSLANYWRLTRPEFLHQQDDDVINEIGNLKELLWDVLTSKGLERFDAFCEVLRDVECNQGYVANIIENIDQLLSVVAPSFKYSDRDIYLVHCHCLEDSEVKIDPAFNELRDFDIEILFKEKEMTNILSDISKSPGMPKANDRKLSSRDSLSSSSNRLVASLSVSSYCDSFVTSTEPVLAVGLSRYCLCQGRRMERLRDLLGDDNWSALSELRLVDCHIDCDVLGDKFSWLVDALKNNSTLVTVDLRLSCLGEYGARCLGEVLRYNSTLRVLNLSSTGLTSDKCAQLISGISRHCVLADLDIGFNDIRDTGCRAVAECFSRPGDCPLRKLRMRDNGISCSGAGQLFRSLARNARLYFLDISSNSIGDESIGKLSEALIFNRTLKELNLENCRISAQGCYSLARAIRANASLKHLQLSLNPIEDEGISVLGEGLKYNRGLETLCLNMCAFGNAGFAGLLDSLKCSNGPLKLVKLCYNDIKNTTSSSESGFDNDIPSVEELYYKLCEVLHYNPDMKMLLWGNDLDSLPAFLPYTNAATAGSLRNLNISSSNLVS